MKIFQDGVEILTFKDADGTEYTVGELASKAESGFPNRVDSVISFVDGTRTFTIAPAAASFNYYIKGKKYNKDTPQNIVIPDTEGFHWIYFVDDALTTSTVFTDTIIEEYAFVAGVYWDATNKLAIGLFEERHGHNMAWGTHSYLHNIFGAKFDSGLVASPKVDAGTGDGSNVDHAYISISDGIIRDEDIKMEISHADSPSNPFEQVLNHSVNGNAKIPMYYKTGASGDWRKTAATDFPFHQGSSRIQTNTYSGSIWAKQDASEDGYFVAVWLFASNNINEPIVAVIGQREDPTLADASNNNRYDLLAVPPLPAKEFAPLARLIFKTDSSFSATQGVLYKVDDLRVDSLAGVGSRNLNDFEYFTLTNLFRSLANSHSEHVFLPDLLKNAYIDTFTDRGLIDEIYSTAVTGSSCILDLNPLYRSESSVLEDYESDTGLRQCNFADCSKATFVDSAVTSATTAESGVSVSPRNGTRMGRLARAANPGTQLAFWTCVLSTDITVAADSTSIKLWVNVPVYSGINIPISVHLRDSGDEFYATTQFIESTTVGTGGWQQFIFNIENCTFRAAVNEVGVSIGQNMNNTVDTYVYVDDVTVTSGTIKNTHGYFKRAPLNTLFDIDFSLSDRLTVAPIEVGWIENHISLDGGVHFKKAITISTFISALGGGEIESPNFEYKESQTLTQQALTFRYEAPSGDNNLEMFHPYDSNTNNMLPEAALLFEDSFATDTLSDWNSPTTTAGGSVAWNAGGYIDVIDGGNNQRSHIDRSPINSYVSDQYLECIVSLKDNATASILSYQTAGICCRTTDNNTLGYWAGIHHNGTNTRFVIGKDIAIVATGTYTSPVQATQYLVQFAVQDSGANVKLSARFFDSTMATLHDSLTYTDTTAVIATGDIGFFAGAVAGISNDCLGTFDVFKENYGYGAYTHVQSAPDYIDFIPGRAPSGTVYANYFKPFIGDWDSKQSLVVIAHIHKTLESAAHTDSPEIDDFLQVVKVTEQ